MASDRIPVELDLVSPDETVTMTMHCSAEQVAFLSVLEENSRGYSS